MHGLVHKFAAGGAGFRRVVEWVGWLEALEEAATVIARLLLGLALRALALGQVATAIEW